MGIEQNAPRFVGREVTKRIKVYAIAKSDAEADAIEAAIRALPVSEAWLPGDAPEPPEVPEGHPAIADEVVPEPMDRDEAVAR